MEQNYTIYIKKFKTAIIILIFGLLIFAVLLSKIVPMTKAYADVNANIKNKSNTLQDFDRKLADIKAAAERKSEENAEVAKIFFRPIDTGLDTEAIMADEFAEILVLIRENLIKARSIKYDYALSDDNFVVNGGGKFSACKLDMELIATYSDFKNFLKDLYRHEHFLEISNIEITPYQKDRKILLINLQLKLYAKRADDDTGFMPPFDAGTPPPPPPSGQQSAPAPVKEAAPPAAKSEPSKPQQQPDTGARKVKEGQNLTPQAQ